MSREITPSSAESGGAGAPKREHLRTHSGGALNDTAEVLGTLWAALAGLTIGAFETLADRKAERRSRRIRSRMASDRPHPASGREDSLRG